MVARVDALRGDNDKHPEILILSLLLFFIIVLSLF